MHGIIWRKPKDLDKQGLKEMTKIIQQYKDVGIEVVNTYHSTSAMRVKNIFANGDVWELIPANESDILGQRYNVALIDYDIPMEITNHIILSAHNSRPYFSYNYY